MVPPLTVEHQPFPLVHDGTYANDNFGLATLLDLKNDNLSWTRMSLMKFDLPPRVISATLTITIVSMLGDDASRTVRIRPISNVWDEYTVTWDSLGTITTSNAQDVQFDVAYTASLPFDVVIDVSSLLPSSSGSTQTFSLFFDFASPIVGNNHFSIESKEAAGSSGATLSTAR